MAAYAALVSLMNLLEQLQCHPQPPITLQTNQVEILTQKIAFLQHFLEVYNSHYSKPEMERLRNQITDVAYAAEDVIETHIIKQFRFRSKTYVEEINSSLRDLSLEVENLPKPSADASTIYDEKDIGSIDLHEVIRDMSFVEKEVLEIKDTLGTQDPQRSAATNVASKSTSAEHNTMVGFDDVLIQMLDKLSGQSHSSREIIPISGMGGIGKTTLARNAYINPFTENHFDVRAWITISQQYNVRDILSGALNQIEPESLKSTRKESEAEIGKDLYKSLYGRRYLIVMDDMWSHDPWDRVNRFFPKECNGSRIIVTTRLTNVASYLRTNCCGLEMDLLDQNKSWCLFCKTVFGEEEGCPSELEHVGKEISRNCKGLPLSIVVLGGLLAKSRRTCEYWKYIAGNLNSIVNLEENELCFRILHASYDELPTHLKACFLYMGFFPEDHEIRVSELIGMWVAEGFLKPIGGENLEESAEEYLMDLVGRNLIMVHEDDLSRKEILCTMHDLLRDLCIREARKEKFICVANQHFKGLNTQRRIAIHQDNSGKKYFDSLKGGSSTRSLICYSEDVLPLAQLRFLRIYKRIDIILGDDLKNYILEDIFRLVNMRYLSIRYNWRSFIIPSSISQLWNLQTIYVYGGYAVIAPPEIWKLPLIRHIQSSGLILPDPPSGHPDGRDDYVLHSLHTLWGISNLKLGDEVMKRILNVRKLDLSFDDRYEMPFDLNNLDSLYKLEYLSLLIRFRPIHPPSRTELMQNITFPHSLKKLALFQTELHWEDISTKIGPLPHLQMVILGLYSFIGPEWKTVEGQFCSLKHLQINGCYDLECWSTESTHFPCLECLHLVGLHKLEEIPLCIGDIPTLKSIIVEACSDSVVRSAKRILDEQEELGNESLRVRTGLEI